MGFSRPNVVVGVCADGVMGGGLGSAVEIGVTCDVGAVVAEEEAAVLSAVEAVSYVAMVALERTTESGRTTCW